MSEKEEIAPKKQVVAPRQRYEPNLNASSSESEDETYKKAFLSNTMSLLGAQKQAKDNSIGNELDDLFAKVIKK